MNTKKHKPPAPTAPSGPLNHHYSTGPAGGINQISYQFVQPWRNGCEVSHGWTSQPCYTPYD